ncbi:Macrophage mannose receptor 1 [Liparis tanakae]|uniref:Macrophage mannose receptor 1 n=1 Tax=Liparis tanakae TaxID=230148 RepID=A0A4Z2E0K7_9TELE|nr:Macrophage mannose receptor 1 [Liparis tanakae]
MTWTEAQSYCREHHTDLISVRNMEENQMIQNLIPSDVRIWIGLFRDRWPWSDGSDSSFKDWNPLVPRPPDGYSDACVAADFSADGYWETLDCNVKSVFICYIGFPLKHQGLANTNEVLFGNILYLIQQTARLGAALAAGWLPISQQPRPVRDQAS